MNQIFEKKFKKNLPKRTFSHKLHIFLTLIWLLNLTSSALAGNKFLMALHAICVFCWGVNWFISARKYREVVAEYETNFKKEQHDEEMKNAFNFGYYKQK